MEFISTIEMFEMFYMEDWKNCCPVVAGMSYSYYSEPIAPIACRFGLPVAFAEQPADVLAMQSGSFELLDFHVELTLVNAAHFVVPVEAAVYTLGKLVLFD